MKNQKGFAHIFGILLVVIIIGAVGYLGWRAWQQQQAGDEAEDEESSLVLGEPSVTFEREGVVFSNTRINNIEVIKLPDGKYRAFYHSDPGSIKSAVSTDGKKFTLEQGVRLSGGAMPSLAKLDDGSWRMYYSSDGELLSAISKNGFDFTKEAGVRLGKGAAGELDRYGVVHPHVLQLTDGTYRMYYDGLFRDGQGPFWRIMSARSQDGLNWEKDEGSRIPVDVDPNDDGDESDSREVDTLVRYKFEFASHGHVRYENGKFVMYFHSTGEPMSHSGVWRATSEDGVKFTVEKAPVLPRDSQFGDEKDFQTVGGPKGVPQDAFVIDVDGGQRLFYWTSDKGYQSAFRKME